MFEIIFLTASAIYFLILIYLSLGLSKKFTTQDKKPYVSVIIAARNEEENIVKCMQSLYDQDYSDLNYEVIIADDHSTDNTSALIERFIADKKCFKKLVPDKESRLTGKVNALKSAVDASSGDILLFSDADCILPSSWISGMVKYYDDNTGMVNSFSVTNAEGIISGMQSIDLVFLISVAAGMANNGYPVSCIGNNMSVKKEAYNMTGGYSQLPASVTEDYALLNGIKSLDKYKIIFPVDEKIIVTTKAHTSLKELLGQKKRWALGGLSAPNISLLLMIISYTVNLLMVLSLFFYSSGVFTIILFKLLSEILFLHQVHKQLGITKNLRYFFFFEIYYILYTLLLPIILLFSRKIVWKGRTY
jgi:cellulose synthase/poly-beta-1,6-N-acetylglucosamine synthase-like glycosyltransferase